ncbi:MAG: hypothetical protein JWL76_2384 [Thermoleophilia bacterium]|nr:hypothetical protein [Thermoleophilia bacterium]
MEVAALETRRTRRPRRGVAVPVRALPLPPTGDVRQPLPIQLPEPPPKDQRGLKQPMIEGPQHLLHDPPPLPSVAERVRMIVADLDWNAPALTIWVPGTSEYWIKQRFIDELHLAAPGAHVTMIPYESTWRFSTSVPDGAAVLQGVLDEIHRRAPRKPVFLSGESQGAWIISKVLSDPAYASIVTRASIWGHPAAAPQAFGRPGQVREHNSPGDIVTMELGNNPGAVLAAVEQLSRRNFGTGLAQIAAYAVQRPDMLVKLIRFWSYALPIVGKGKKNDHDYDDDLANGIQHLLGGLDPATRAAFQRHRDPRMSVVDA